MTPAKAMALGWAVVVFLSACGGSSKESASAGPDPASVEKGRAICAGFFDDLQPTPERVEQARQVSPQLGSVLATFAELRAEYDAGVTPVEELKARANMAKAGLEIVCADEFGVVPPAGYADPPPADPTPVS